MEEPRAVDVVEEEFAEWLGVKPPTYQEKLTLFIAHKDRTGALVPDIDDWIAKAESVLSNLGGGATSDAVRGAWQPPSGPLLYEPTTLVYTFAPPKRLQREHVQHVREFMTEYGRDTNQGAVALLLENPEGHWFFELPRTAYEKTEPPQA